MCYQNLARTAQWHNTTDASCLEKLSCWLYQISVAIRQITHTLGAGFMACQCLQAMCGFRSKSTVLQGTTGAAPRAWVKLKVGPGDLRNGSPPVSPGPRDIAPGEVRGQNPKIGSESSAPGLSQEYCTHLTENFVLDFTHCCLQHLFGILLLTSEAVYHGGGR